MDRGRRAAATARRKPRALSASPHSFSDMSPDMSLDRPPSPTTPITMSAPAASPQTAPPHARRPSRPAVHRFSFSSPSSVRPSSAKRRAQPLESLAFADDLSVVHGSPQKGGHSLRKRARVDYTLEHIDDDPMAPASSTASSAARSKKRRPEQAEAPEHANGPQAFPKKPGNPLVPDAAGGLRCNPTRKGAEPKTYRHDDDVKDTIEFGIALAHPNRPENPPSGHSPGLGDSPSTSTSFRDTQETLTAQDTQLTVPTAHLASEKPGSLPWSTTDGPNHDSTAQASAPASRHDTAQPHEEHSSVDESAVTNSADDHGSASDAALAAAPIETEEQHGAEPPQPPSQDSTALEAEEDFGKSDKRPPEHGPRNVEHRRRPSDKPLNTTPLDAARAPSDPSVPEVTEAPAGPFDGDMVVSTSPTDQHPAAHNPSIQSLVDYRDDREDEGRVNARDYKALLSAYVENEYELYPGEKLDKDENADADEVQSEGQAPDIKDESNHADVPQPAMDLSSSVVAAAAEAATPAVDTPARDSPTPEVVESMAADSPNATASGDNDDFSAAVTHDTGQRPTLYRFRKIRNPADFVEVLKNHKTMSTQELTEVLAVVNNSIKDLFDEYQKEKWMVEDYEHSLKRRDADEKYEIRTQDLNDPSTSYEEPDFVVRGSRAIQNSKDRAAAAENRRVQDWDRVMSSQYGFPYVDQQVVKVNGQDVAVPNGDVEGVVTRQRARGGVKVAEAAQESGRDKMPAAGKTGRKIAKATPRPAEPAPVGEGTLRETGGKRKRGAKELVSRQAEQDDSEFTSDCKRVKISPKNRQGTRLLTLKLNPMAMRTSEVYPALQDNGSSRPSSSSSESTSNTAESAYSFRPKRQKRFFNEPGHVPAAEPPPSKKNKRPAGPGAATAKDGGVGDNKTAGATPSTEAVASPFPPARKIAKIKVVSKVRNSTPAASPPCAAGTDERPKDYKSMTKSEKMSASMKSRWANGNMAGAVEKRKATLAAKKAAQVAADHKVGSVAPKPAKANKSCKKETAAHSGPAPAVGSHGSRPASPSSRRRQRAPLAVHSNRQQPMASKAKTRRRTEAVGAPSSVASSNLATRYTGENASGPRALGQCVSSR